MRPGQPPRWRCGALHFVAWLALVTSILVAPVATAQTAPTASAGPSAAPSASAAPTASVSAAASAAPPVPSDVAAVQERARQVRALADGTLDPAVDEATLFDVDLTNPRAVAVRRARLARLVDAAAPPPVADAGVPADAGPPADAGAGGATADADAGAPLAADDALLAAHLELDRARLAFLSLPEAERTKRLTAHAERRRRSKAARMKKDLTAAERERREAAAARRRAEQAAKQARNEAVRRASTERARLLGLKETYAKFEADLIAQETKTAALAEKLLGWAAKTDELLARPPSNRPDPAVAGAAYDDLARHLGEARDGLENALDTLEGPGAELAPVGDDPLAGLALDIDTTDIAELRVSLLQREGTLRKRAADNTYKRAQQQAAALEALDQRRRSLMPLLSSAKRGELTSFGAVGVGQARNEVVQVQLKLRYHFYEMRRFVSHVRDTGDAGDSALLATLTALKWLIPIGLFVWWRRRAESVFDRLEESSIKAASQARHPKNVSRATSTIVFARRVRRPLEWLLLLWAVVQLLPVGAAKLLEVQLAASAVAWPLGGWLAVNAINALLSDDRRERRTQVQTAHLRLRTLRLLGMLSVAFGLLLALTQKLVGEGTIYRWVWVALWVSAVPLALLIVRWWRPLIFHFVGTHRKKGKLLRWVAQTESGWASFAAAIVGGLYLLLHGLWKIVRHRLGAIDGVKRLLAYWFRREVSRQAEHANPELLGEPLDAKTYHAFDPEAAPPSLVASVADAQTEGVIARIKEPGGGVYAVVGERGAGKSTLLKRIDESADDTTRVICPASGRAGFRPILREALGLGPDASQEEIAALLDTWSNQSALLIDDAHHLVRPVVDGLDEFDAMLALARASSKSCTWVFSFDAVIWQMLSRAREVRPLFDDIIKLTPWSEEGIVRLLGSWSDAAEVDPDFSPLMSELPEDADEYDESDALAHASSGYYRLLWDYSLGNPGVSLHFWRASLRQGDDGRFPVRLFDPPPTDDLERLPDSTVFVLRAIVQLDLASVDDIIEATLLEVAQVEDALRYVLARRYVEVLDERYRVRWTWFRTITRFLARRHLLMGPYE